MKPLTNSQLATIIHIFKTCGTTQPFTPQEIYPARDARSNAGRRICHTLADKGLLKRVQLSPDQLHQDHLIDGNQHYRYRLHYDAFTETLRQHNLCRLCYNTYDPTQVCQLCHFCSNCCECGLNEPWDEDLDDIWSDEFNVPDDCCIYCGEIMIDDLEIGQGYHVTAPCWMYATGQRDLAAQWERQQQKTKGTK